MHSCTSDNPTKRLLLFDYRDTHIVNFSAKTSETISKTFFRSLITDNTLDIFYAINTYDAQEDGGLYQLDIPSSFKNAKPSKLPLANFSIGANYEIVIGLDKSRIGFF